MFDKLPIQVRNKIIKKISDKDYIKPRFMTWTSEQNIKYVRCLEYKYELIGHMNTIIAILKLDEKLESNLYIF